MPQPRGGRVADIDLLLEVTGTGAAIGKLTGVNTGVQQLRGSAHALNRVIGELATPVGLASVAIGLIGTAIYKVIAAEQEHKRQEFEKELAKIAAAADIASAGIAAFTSALVDGLSKEMASLKQAEAISRTRLDTDRKTLDLAYKRSAEIEKEIAQQNSWWIGDVRRKEALIKELAEQEKIILTLERRFTGEVEGARNATKEVRDKTKALDEEAAAYKRVGEAIAEEARRQEEARSKRNANPVYGPTEDSPEVRQALELAEAWDGLAESARLSIGEGVGGAFEQMGEAIGSAMVRGRLEASAIGNLLRNVTADILRTLAQQAIAKGGIQVAEGLAALVTPGLQGTAAGHFASAAQFFAVAGLAGVGAGALQGGANGGGGGGGGGSIAGSEPDGTGGGVNQQIIIIGAPDAQLIEDLEEMLARARESRNLAN